jgi:hypothetical protein
MAMGAKNAYEDAQPLLPAEYLALKADERAKLLHPDTACLLVMQVCQTAAQLQPELAKTKDWLMPVLVRAQGQAQGSGTAMRGMNLGLPGTGGNTIPGGMDNRTGAGMAGNSKHGGKFPPMLFFCSDRDAEIEVQNWILARICIARVEGQWDSPERKQALLKLATPLVPSWDPILAERLRKCTGAVKA